MKLLVTSASRHAATHGIADAIAQRLAERGLQVVVADAAAAPELDGYDAVVLGSGIYAGRWLKAARLLVDRLEACTPRPPIWLFSSGPIGDPPEPAGEAEEPAGFAQRLEARAHRTFAGRLAYARLGPFERTVVKALRAPEGDFRDWPQVRAWADEIADDLLGAGAGHTDTPGTDEPAADVEPAPAREASDSACRWRPG